MSGRFFKIKYPELHFLKLFLEKAGNSLKTFRYFENRNFESIKNHVLTAILIDEEIPVAYGHLDIEKDTVWLGICVAEKSLGLGYGKKMLNFLLTSSDQIGLPKLTLTVDRSNRSAISLYEKNNFVLIKDLGEVLKYERVK